MQHSDTTALTYQITCCGSSCEPDQQHLLPPRQEHFGCRAPSSETIIIVSPRQRPTRRAGGVSLETSMAYLERHRANLEQAIAQALTATIQAESADLTLLNTTSTGRGGWG